MKKLATSVVFPALIVFCISGCAKQLGPGGTGSISPTIFTEISAPAAFSWSTTTKVNLSFVGAAANDYSLVLQVIDPDGNVLLQKLQKSTENFKAVMEVPAHFDSLTVSYGSISEKHGCKQGSVSLTID
jgi:hypothetical protein